MNLSFSVFKIVALSPEDAFLGVIVNIKPQCYSVKRWCYRDLFEEREKRKRIQETKAMKPKDKHIVYNSYSKT